MNFEGLDPSLADYAAPLHAALEPVLDGHLPPSLLPSVELDAEGVPLEGMAVPEPVHLLEGMYSELHTAVSEVGVPVAASHFDLHEEMLWVGNHGVGARGGGGGEGERGAGSCSGRGCAAPVRSCRLVSEHRPAARRSLPRPGGLSATGGFARVCPRSGHAASPAGWHRPGGSRWPASRRELARGRVAFARVVSEGGRVTGLSPAAVRATPPPSSARRWSGTRPSK